MGMLYIGADNMKVARATSAMYANRIDALHRGVYAKLGIQLVLVSVN